LHALVSHRRAEAQRHLNVVLDVGEW